MILKLIMEYTQRIIEILLIFISKFIICLSWLCDHLGNKTDGKICFYLDLFLIIPT